MPEALNKWYHSIVFTQEKRGIFSILQVFKQRRKKRVTTIRPILVEFLEENLKKKLCIFGFLSKKQ
jgi:hypothetical protein